MAWDAYPLLFVWGERRMDNVTWHDSLPPPYRIQRKETSHLSAFLPRPRGEVIGAVVRRLSRRSLTPPANADLRSDVPQVSARMDGVNCLMRCGRLRPRLWPGVLTDIQDSAKTARR